MGTLSAMDQFFEAGGCQLTSKYCVPKSIWRYIGTHKFIVKEHYFFNHKKLISCLNADNIPKGHSVIWLLVPQEEFFTLIQILVVHRNKKDGIFISKQNILEAVLIWILAVQRNLKRQDFFECTKYTKGCFYLDTGSTQCKKI